MEGSFCGTTLSIIYLLYLVTTQETMLCRHCTEELSPKGTESEQSRYIPDLVKYKTVLHCCHLQTNNITHISIIYCKISLPVLTLISLDIRRKRLSFTSMLGGEKAY